MLKLFLLFLRFVFVFETKTPPLETIANVSVLFFLLCRENDTSGVIDTTFSVEHNAYGAIQVYDLKTNGRDVVVTEENKREYVRYDLLLRRLMRSYLSLVFFESFIVLFPVSQAVRVVPVHARHRAAVSVAAKGLPRTGGAQPAAAVRRARARAAHRRHLQDRHGRLAGQHPPQGTRHDVARKFS